MKYIMILLFVITGHVNQQSDLAEARMLYNKAVDNEEAAQSLLEISEKRDNSEPVMLGYKAAGHMMMAKHVGNPFKKMSHFKKGKEILDNVITADRTNLELRFLRFAVQAEAPGFLGYRDNLEEDKLLLLNGVGKLQDQVLKRMILNYLKTSKGLSKTENKIWNKTTEIQ